MVYEEAAQGSVWVKFSITDQVVISREKHHRYLLDDATMNGVRCDFLIAIRSVLDPTASNIDYPVFTTNRDPVEIVLVASLNRPSGNMTGATNLSIELEPKLVELMHDAVPGAKIICVRQPNQFQSRNHFAKSATSRPHVRTATSCLECQQ